MHMKCLAYKPGMISKCLAKKSLTKTKNNMKKYFTILMSMLFLCNVNAQDFWQPTNGPFYQSTTDKVTIWSLTFDHDTIYAGVDDQYLGGVRKSVDFGENWIDIGYNLSSSGTVHSVAYKNGYVYSSDEGGVYKKCNNCTSWELIKSISALKKMMIAPNGTILAINDLTSDGKLYRSIDNGLTWDEPSSGMPTGFSNNTVFSSSAGTIFWATNNGVYKSIDNGSTWVASATSTYFTFAQAFAEAPNGDIYVALTNGVQGAIFYTSDNGVNWLPVSMTGVSQVGFRAMAINSIGNIFVSAANTGSTTPAIYKYSEGSWSDITSGITAGTYCNDFAFDNNGIAYVATVGEGVYKSINSTLGINNNKSQEDLTILYYPNPAKDFLNVIITESGTFEVRTIEGELISNRVVNKGAVTIDISDLSKGMYLINVKTENGVVVKKFVKE